MTSKLNNIKVLQELMKSKAIEAYLLSCQDEFQNEFPPAHSQRLRWLTCFSGTNAITIITHEKLYFFTDGRYLTQARQQLDKKFIICDLADRKEISKLCAQLKLDIYYDPMIFSISFLEYFQKLFAENINIKFTALEENLIDLIWQRVFHYPTKSPMTMHSKFTSESAVVKINKITKNFQSDYLLITSPATICWLLNIRGFDTKYTPIIMCYCLIAQTGDIELFSFLKKYKSTVNNLKLFDFKKFKQRFLSLCKHGYSIQFDKEAPIWFQQNCPNARLQPNPATMLQSIKNSVELSGIEFAHRQDGCALIRLIKWLYENQHNLPTELEVDAKLDQFKALGNLYMHKSFSTIAGFGINSAIIHYNATKSSNLKLDTNNLFLLDSGSQYKTGTTDVTRCFHLGIPKNSVKTHYTLVLKCLIKLSSLHFPIGTNGCQLDAIAREHLWLHGYDYPHSTGHGVGHFLNVHEGPIAVSKNSFIPLKENMLLSIEPGLYFPGQYGIRIENLAVIKKSSFKNFLRFKTITKVPINTNLIDFTLLKENEITWLQDYHKNIILDISPFLNQEENNFLQKICSVPV